MADEYGLKCAAERSIALGEVGQRVVLENEYVRFASIPARPSISTSIIASS
jgi:hypothetical protein